MSLSIPLIWYPPTIITVKTCGQYKKEVMLFPTSINGVNLGYGKKTFVFNQSEKDIYFENIHYGVVDNSGLERNQTIKSNHFAELNTYSIDYIFEDTPKSVSSKSRGTTKTRLYCF